MAYLIGAGGESVRECAGVPLLDDSISATTSATGTVLAASDGRGNELCPGHW